MIAIFTKVLFKSYQDRILKTANPIVDKVNSFEASIRELSDDELAAKTVEFRQRLADGEKLNNIMPEAFAVVREASVRTIGMRHYDVQVVGGYFLNKGNIAEMKTGEGKTLVASLALYLNSLTGKGAHLVTVNDYLARRDATWMGPIYKFLGMSVGIVQSNNTSYVLESDPDNKHATTAVEATRTQAYAADITYGTNNEFGFDYLRDNMKHSTEEYLQRGHNFAIVDEVDSILIDEARTPLIISGTAPSDSEGFIMANNIAKNLIRNTHYEVIEKNKTIKLLDAGIDEAQKQLGVDNLYHTSNVDKIHYISNALRAHGAYKLDVDYVIDDNKIVIVDEFTGRMMPGRRYGEGLHQAIEAKEGIIIESENQTLASITFQNYFRMYDKLAGMTGTALTEAEEFQQIYKLGVISIPTNVPVTRTDDVDVIYKTQTAKFNAIIKDIVHIHQQGRPILIGTVSIETSEFISSLLKKHNIAHKVLNAKHHTQEAHIIESAGQLGALTIATNMAGRGTDIKLGDGVAAIGGLHIIGTERHESRRIDNQLRGRAGRQGDPGSSRFYISMEDTLMRIFNGDKVKSLMNTLRIPDDEPIQNKLISRSIQSSQKKVEAHNFEIRKHLLEYDNINNEQRHVIYAMRKEAINSDSVDYINEVTTEFLNNVVDTIVQEYTTQGSPNYHNKDWLREQLLLQFGIQVDENGNNLNTDADADDNLNLSNGATLAADIIKIVEKQILAQKSMMGTLYLEVGKDIMLRCIDTKWITHLQSMAHLRDSVSLRGYGQKDPLIEYKKEAYGMFVELLQSIESEYLRLLLSVRLTQGTPPQNSNTLKAANAKATHQSHGSLLAPSTGGNPNTNGSSSSGSQPEKPKGVTIRNTGQKIGRNQPCPCGSGKKYKNCHGSLAAKG